MLLNNIILNGFVIIALLNNSHWICDDSGIISPCKCKRGDVCIIFHFFILQGNGCIRELKFEMLKPLLKVHKNLGGWHLFVS